MLDAETGSLNYSWGKKLGMIAQNSGTWGAHGIAVEECVTDCSSDSLSKLRVYIDDFSKYTLSAFGAVKGDWIFEVGTEAIGNNTGP